MSLYLIPEDNLPGLAAAIERLAKRAAKIGVPAPTLTAIERVDVPRIVNGHDTGLIDTAVRVDVVGDAPVYEGWRFIAHIDIDREEGPPHVVTALEGTEVDEAWRTAPDNCDHCNLRNKGRKSLVVVEHETGERKVVGSTCLHDFLGHTSPQAIAAWATLLLGLDDLVGGYTGGPRAEWRVRPEVFLGYVARAIEAHGWVSRTVARNSEGDLLASADLAIALFDAADEPPLTDAERAEGEAALAWAAEIEPGDNDYLANVLAVASKSGWRHRDLGLGGSILQAYRRETERTAPAPAPTPSHHRGVVGDKITFEASVVSARSFDGDYGLRWLIEFDADGDRLAWWTSESVVGKTAESARITEEGLRVRATAKVKAHETYRGVDRTVVSYVDWSPVEGVPTSP